MARNTLIFSDGTSQAGGLTPDQSISNIYKLYRSTRCGPDTAIGSEPAADLLRSRTRFPSLIAECSLSPARTAGYAIRSVRRPVPPRGLSARCRLVPWREWLDDIKVRTSHIVANRVAHHEGCHHCRNRS
jgi:hypothetical protein